MNGQPTNDAGTASGEIDGSSIVSSRRLTKNVGWNLAGMILPLIGLVLATPMIVDSLGLQSLGLISVAWASIGYFAMLDLGLGRTIAHFVSRSIGDDRPDRLRPLVLTADMALLALGITFAVILFVSSARIAGAIAEDAGQLAADITDAIRILSTAVPFVVVGTGFQGLLQAFQRFGIINIIRVPVATATYLAPALMALATGSLFAAMIALVGVRIAGSIALGFATRGLVPRGNAPRFLSMRESAAVLKYGGWLTVSSIVSPILVYIDKVMVTAVVSLTAVAYYSTSFDIASKLLILPASVAAVAFPALSMTMSKRSEMARSGRIYRGTSLLALVMVMAAGAVLSAVASSGLAIWVGDEFAAAATVVLVMLAAASVVNGVAQAPYGLIQAGGRPDITAKLHLIEAPVYIAVALVLISAYGIEGAAIAWGLRVAADAILLIWFSGRFLPDDGARARPMALLLLLAPAAVIVSALPPGLPLRLVMALVATVLVAVVGWRTLLFPADRAPAVQLVRSYLPVRGSRS